MNPEASLKPGDFVNLRSGGPPMTVIDVGRDTGLVWCRWMDESGGKVREHSFPPQMLKHWKP